MRIRNLFMTSVLCVTTLSACGQSIAYQTLDAKYFLEKTVEDTKPHSESFFLKSSLLVGFKSNNLFDEKDTFGRLIKINFDQQKRCAGPCDGLYIASPDPKISQFYVISPKDEKKIRWDKYCKSCRKIIKNNKKILSGNIDVVASFEAKIKNDLKNLVALPELLKTDNSEAHNHESNMLCNKIDFTRMETCLGEKLLNGQRDEAVSNFNNFISLLREEYGKVTGEYLYVKQSRSVKSPIRENKF
ncbi:MAG: hypothetical protein HOP07_03865 [Bacteriovoracaceae bacterium]|nr:hypothetical protein [Bacteriovoracaceae bacterium]